MSLFSHPQPKVTVWIDSRPFAARVLDTPWGRARGWLFRRTELGEQALLFRPCRAVHFWGTNEPLDVFLLDSEGCLLRYRRCAPWSRPMIEPKAVMALEVATRFCPTTWNPRSVCLQNPQR